MENSDESNSQRAPGSLRRSLLLSLAATTLIPLTLLAVVVLYFMTERAAEDVSSKNQLLVSTISGQVELFLRAPETSLINLRNLYLSHQGSLGHSFQEILDAMAESSQLLESIFIIDRQGVVTDVGLPQKNRNLRAEFERLSLGHLSFIMAARQQQQPVWSDTFLSIITGKTSLALAIPVDDDIIVGNINIALINRFLKELRQGRLVESTIVDRHGEIIACSRQNHDLCPSNLWNLPLIRTAAYKGATTETYEYRGETFLGSVARIDGPNWFILVAQSSATAYEPVRRTSLFFIGAFLITFLVVLLVALLTSKRISAPLSRFARQARALADGDYDLQQLTPGYAEIAVLADDFQHMASRISEREVAVKESEEAYRTLAENLPAIAYRLHIADNSRLQFMNQEHRTMTGFEEENFKVSTDSSPFEEKIHPDDRQDFSTTIKGAISGRTPFTQEYRFKHANGEFRTFYEKGCPVYDSKGKISHIDGVIFDVTERKQAEDIILQSEKMLTVGGLAAGMAHEINNPLAGILQNCQLIRWRLDATQTKNLQSAKETGVDLLQLQQYLQQRNILQMLDAIRDSGQRAARIVENILDFSRKSQKDFSPQNIPELIEKSLELARSDYNLHREFDFRNIEINCHFDDNLPKVHCDPAQIQQVLLNIFKNGAQAMIEHDKNRRHQFQIRSSQQQGMICIEISDNGPGMPADVEKRVFEPFFTTKKVGKGMGLGLSVCYFIITEKHHGSMKVSSTPGEGTKFTICLPLLLSAEQS